MVWERHIHEGTHRPLQTRQQQSAIKYQDEIFEPTVRLYTGAMGPGFLLVHNNTRPHVMKGCENVIKMQCEVLTPPCLRIEVGSSNRSSLMQALHFCSPELENRKNKYLYYYVCNVNVKILAM